MADPVNLISGRRTCELDRYRIHLLLLEKQEKEKDVCIWNQQKEYQIFYGKLIYTNEAIQSHRSLMLTIFYAKHEKGRNVSYSAENGHQVNGNK